MNIKLTREERLDYQSGGKVLRIAAKTGAIDRTALCYLTTSLMVLIDREVPMQGDEHQLLDDAVGLVMQLTAGSSTSTPSHYQETRF